MQISRRDALLGATAAAVVTGAAVVVAGVPGAAKGDDAEAPDRLATAEDYLAITFEGEPDLKLPTWDEWDAQAWRDFSDVILGYASLRFSNTELAEKVREMGGVLAVSKLYEALQDVEQRHRGLADHLETIMMRLFVAMMQAYRNEVGLVQFKLELGTA